MALCYTCKHRRGIAGDCHSQCVHPSIGGYGNALAIVAGLVHPPKEMGIEGDPHGIAHGWFVWPINFDPVWLKACRGHEPATPQQA